jgi:ketosteroid isomerase-like protein
MSSTRDIMDRMTAALIAQDLDALTSYYRPDAVLTAPEGTFKGRDQIAEFFRTWIEPFSAPSVDVRNKAEWGHQAMDEWTFSCTNTGPLPMPTGTVPATNRRVAVRGADVCTIEDGAVVEHHLYYDQVELLGQLGLLPD